MQSCFQFLVSVFLFTALQSLIPVASANEQFGTLVASHNWEDPNVAMNRMDEKTNHAYRTELLSMANKEQSLRADFRSATAGGSAQEMTQKKASVRELALQIHASQSEHSENLKRLIKEFGFPDSDLVGVDGAHAAFLIVQHSLDKPFRSEFLQFAEDAANRGVFSKLDLAYLIDRNRMFEGKPQLYGTQRNPDGSLYTIEQPSALAQRRKMMGLAAADE